MDDVQDETWLKEEDERPSSKRGIGKEKIDRKGVQPTQHVTATKGSPSFSLALLLSKLFFKIQMAGEMP